MFNYICQNKIYQLYNKTWLVRFGEELTRVSWNKNSKK